MLNECNAQMNLPTVVKVKLGINDKWENKLKSMHILFEDNGTYMISSSNISNGKKIKFEKDRILAVHVKQGTTTYIVNIWDGARFDTWYKQLENNIYIPRIFTVKSWLPESTDIISEVKSADNECSNALKKACDDDKVLIHKDPKKTYQIGRKLYSNDNSILLLDDTILMIGTLKGNIINSDIKAAVMI